MGMERESGREKNEIPIIRERKGSLLSGAEPHGDVNPSANFLKVKLKNRGK